MLRLPPLTRSYAVTLATLWFAVCSPALGADAADPATAQASRVLRGTVAYRTRARVYLDRGQRDGLVSGAQVELRRSTASPTCTVDTVADHFAACTSERAAIGASFTAPVSTESAPAKSEDARGRKRPRRITRRAVRRTLAALRQTPFEPVTHPRNERGREIGVTVSGASRAHVGEATASLWREASAGVTVRRAQLGASWLRLNASLLAHRFDPPTSVGVTVAADPSLYIWELAVQAGDARSRWQAWVGRFQPHGVPGALTLDGAQVSMRLRQETRVGIYGGRHGGPLESIATATPTLGAFYDALRLSASGSWVRHQVRLAYLAPTTSAGPRLQVQPALLWSLGGAIRVSSQLALSAPAGALRELSLAVASLHVDTSLGDKLTVAAEARHISDDGTALLSPLATATLPWTHQRADLDLTYQLTPRLHLSWISVATYLPQVERVRAGAGPQLQLRDLWQRGLSLALGHREEVGWSAGRLSFFQGQWHGHDGHSAFIRMSYAADAYDKATLTSPLRQLLLTLAAEARLGLHLTANATLSALVPLTRSPSDSVRYRGGIVLGQLTLHGQWW